MSSDFLQTVKDCVAAADGCWVRAVLVQWRRLKHIVQVARVRPGARTPHSFFDFLASRDDEYI